MPAEPVVKFNAATAQSRSGHSRPPGLRRLKHMPMSGRGTTRHLAAPSHASERQIQDAECVIALSSDGFSLFCGRICDQFDG